MNAMSQGSVALWSLAVQASKLAGDAAEQYTMKGERLLNVSRGLAASFAVRTQVQTKGTKSKEETKHKEGAELLTKFVLDKHTTKLLQRAHEADAHIDDFLSVHVAEGVSESVAESLVSAMTASKAYWAAQAAKFGVALTELMAEAAKHLSQMIPNLEEAVEAGLEEDLLGPKLIKHPKRSELPVRDSCIRAADDRCFPFA